MGAQEDVWEGVGYPRPALGSASGSGGSWRGEWCEGWEEELLHKPQQFAVGFDPPFVVARWPARTLFSDVGRARGGGRGGLRGQVRPSSTLSPSPPGLGPRLTAVARPSTTLLFLRPCLPASRGPTTTRFMIYPSLTFTVLLLLPLGVAVNWLKRNVRSGGGGEGGHHAMMSHRPQERRRNECVCVCGGGGHGLAM